MRSLLLSFGFAIALALPAAALPLPTFGAPDTAHAARLTPLPFFFHSDLMGWTGGVYLRTVDWIQRDAEFDFVLFGSLDGTRYLYHQTRDYRMPGLPRLYFEPTLMVGHFAELRGWTDRPDDRRFAGEGDEFPGHNDSDEKAYMVVDGEDVWLRGAFRWLLPWAAGADPAPLRPRLAGGRLADPPVSGAHWNPLRSGRTFLELEPFLREQAGQRVAGATISLTRDNRDWEDDPSAGSWTRLLWRRDPGAFGSDAPWSVLEADGRIYRVLGGGRDPFVLALNAWTGASPTWNDEHLEADGARSVLHRPPSFAAPALGGDTRLRAYPQNRWNDRAFLYYGAELRKRFDAGGLARWNIHWLQAVLFAEAGRVADAWDPSELHQDMKPSAGVGARVFFTDIVLRVDMAWGEEGALVQMFMDQAF